MLKEDHRIVDGLFKQVEDTPPSKHGPLFKRIKGELETHAHVEETIFYPALKRKGDKELKTMVLEGLEEHHQMKMFLGEVAEITPRNERFEPKLKVLIEDTRHHVKEEEGVGGMFSMAESQLGETAMEKLGQKMLAEKQKFLKANGITPEPRPEPATLGTLTEKAKEMVAGVFGASAANAGDNSKAKASKGNGRPAARSSNSLKRAAATKGTTDTKRASSGSSSQGGATPRKRSSSNARTR